MGNGQVGELPRGHVGFRTVFPTPGSPGIAWYFCRRPYWGSKHILKTFPRHLGLEDGNFRQIVTLELLWNVFPGTFWDVVRIILTTAFSFLDWYGANLWSMLSLSLHHLSLPTPCSSQRPGALMLSRDPQGGRPLCPALSVRAPTSPLLTLPTPGLHLAWVILGQRMSGPGAGLTRGLHVRTRGTRAAGIGSSSCSSRMGTTPDGDIICRYKGKSKTLETTEARVYRVCPIQTALFCTSASSRSLTVISSWVFTIWALFQAKEFLEHYFGVMEPTPNCIKHCTIATHNNAILSF